MEQRLLTAGEFARYAGTTKRTVHWYAKVGVLPPRLVSRSGYRYYDATQIVDFRIVQLLRQLHFSLDEIKQYVLKHVDIKNFLKQKKQLIETQLSTLHTALKEIDLYVQNLESHDLLVVPKIRTIRPYTLYLLKQVAQPKDVLDHGYLLSSYFESIPDGTPYVAAQEPVQYISGQVRVGILKVKNMTLLPQQVHNVEEVLVQKSRSALYKHIGRTSLLPLLWHELERYIEQQGVTRNSNVRFSRIEFHKQTTFHHVDDPEKMIFELHVPIQD